MATAEVKEKIVLRDRSSLSELDPGWSRLAAEAGTTPIQDASWSSAAAETVDAGLALAVVVIGSLERPRAIAPLVRRGRQLELLGAAKLSEPSELLAEDGDALHELAGGIAALRTPVLLQRLPADSPSIPA